MVKRVLGVPLALAILMTALMSVAPAAAGLRRQIVPRSGFYGGRSLDQLVVAVSGQRLAFVNLGIPRGRACAGRVYDHFVSVSGSGRFHGRGVYDRRTRESYSGRFLSSARATGTVSRTEYDSAGRVRCRSSARFEVRWRRAI